MADSLRNRIFAVTNFCLLSLPFIKVLKIVLDVTLGCIFAKYTSLQNIEVCKISQKAKGKSNLLDLSI